MRYEKTDTTSWKSVKNVYIWAPIVRVHHPSFPKILGSRGQSWRLKNWNISRTIDPNLSILSNSKRSRKIDIIVGIWEVVGPLNRAVGRPPQNRRVRGDPLWKNFPEKFSKKIFTFFDEFLEKKSIFYFFWKFFEFFFLKNFWNFFEIFFGRFLDYFKIFLHYIFWNFWNIISKKKIYNQWI